MNHFTLLHPAHTHTHTSVFTHTSTHPVLHLGLAGVQVSIPLAQDSTVRVLHPFYNLDYNTLHSVQQCIAAVTYRDTACNYTLITILKIITP